ncbi:hypothetical protein QYE76_057541 [Lolium multiflorum]|uniref:Decapping nuclease n=1 Tax=Lolium multiflorum TaxID=4521 RepID=A0AAD8WNW6_LOLMU|nr:hypothetical protein QYE76_057541 [Lolium multiflorum]
MDFSEQGVDLFGEHCDARDGAEAEAHGGGGASSPSTSSSSSAAASSSSSAAASSSSSAAASSSSSSGRSSSSGIADGRDDEGHGGEHHSLGNGGEEEEETDLFGPDNEQYVKTSARSRYPVPVLPPLPDTDSVSPGGVQGHGRGVEVCVSHMELNKTHETLSRKAVAFQEPCEFACFSRVEGGDVYFDDRSLRLFKRNICDYVGEDLNRGFESFTEKRDLGSQGFGDLLACIRNSNLPLRNIHFVTYRNNLNKILATAYIKEPWKMGVHKRNGVVYLDVHKLPERPQSKIDRRRCFWGYSFENLATENSIGEDGRGIDANVEYCSVIKTKLGAHRIIMGAEMDCCDATNDGRRFYVELKTSRKLDHHTLKKYEKEKLLRFWIQSFLAGVSYVVVGFRNDAGVLVRTERLRTRDITQKVKAKNYWQGGVCLAFADEVLCWLYGTVKENEDYILQRVHPFDRLELLRAQSPCPEAITQHVEQLSGTTN